MPRRFRLRLAALLVPVALGMALPGAAHSASKVAVAQTADAAPTGGLFAGPGFSNWPAAAGSGWVAFRGEISGRGTAEALVVSHVAPPASSAQVATTGQDVTGSGALAPCTGKIKSFLGRAAVNAAGDVAFLALITPATTDQGTQPPEANPPPTPAAIFVFRGGQLRLLACTGQVTALGHLDLVQQTNPLLDTEVAENPPALNDQGDVAFLSGLVDDNNLELDGALFLVGSDGVLQPVLQIGAPLEGGDILTLGPPALNNLRTLAFHATVGIDSGLIDGVFVSAGGVVSEIAKNGIAPAPLTEDTAIVEFEDPVALNDRGDVAFLGGPIFDLNSTSSLDEGSPGVLVWSGGTVTLVGYVGQKVGPDRVTGTALGPLGGNALPPPALTPDGRAFFFVQLNGGGVEAIVYWRSDFDEPAPIVYTAGTSDPTPAGGGFAGAVSAPAVDALGGVAFFARITGGTASEALVYRATDGTETAVVVGDATPGPSRTGFFGGLPFSAPLLNDRGDVVFRAFVARGPTSVGIFRWRDAKLETLVAAGMPSPTAGGAPFVDLVGLPSLSSTGAVAFAAAVNGLGRGIYAADGVTVRAIALRGDPAPGPAGATFAAFGINPAINASGDVAFRATISSTDALTGFTQKNEGIFLSDANGMHALALAPDPSPVAGTPFLKFRDPVISDVPSVAFRASLGTVAEIGSGIFLSDPDGMTRVLGTGDDLGDGVSVLGFSGDPAGSPGGVLAFNAARGKPFTPGSPLIQPLGPVLLRTDAASIVPVATRSDHGPVGGSLRSIGPPTVNSAGHVVFAASYFAGSGGTSGYLLANETGLHPYVLSREGSPGTARFRGLRVRVSLNASDELAFGASYTGRSSSGDGIYVASPSTLEVQSLRMKLAGSGRRDRIAVRARLRPGRFFDGFAPAKEQVTVALYDTAGLLWSATVPDHKLRGAGKSFVATPGRKSELGRVLKALKVRVSRDGGEARVTATSARLQDLTSMGFRKLKPPFTVGVQVGGDSGYATLDCQVGGTIRCGN